MTPLRRKMIEELQIRRFAPGTQKGYLSCVAKFARHFGRSPDQLGPEDVRAFLLHLVNEAKVSHGVLVNYVSALRFLYKITLQRPWDLQSPGTSRPSPIQGRRSTCPRSPPARRSSTSSVAFATSSTRRS
jgi:hypothetical protein